MSMKILITGAGGFIGGFIVGLPLLLFVFLPTNYYRIKGNTEHGTTSFIIWGLQNAKIPMTSIESTTAL